MIHLNYNSLQVISFLKKLQIFLTSHYAGTELLVKFETGEEWKKVLGPVFTYFNSVSDKDMALSLWDDAKRQVRNKENTDVEITKVNQYRE